MYFIYMKKKQMKNEQLKKMIKQLKCNENTYKILWQKWIN